mmetsp:Transcript_151194/g.466320  ORF Transcript_151194/g.466320 Transcript_151194/m.466320 type:complete len:200 (+) Transcript_151194:259-858(+)
MIAQNSEYSMAPVPLVSTLVTSSWSSRGLSLMPAACSALVSSGRLSVPFPSVSMAMKDFSNSAMASRPSWDAIMAMVAFSNSLAIPKPCRLPMAPSGIFSAASSAWVPLPLPLAKRAASHGSCWSSAAAGRFSTERSRVLASICFAASVTKLPKRSTFTFLLVRTCVRTSSVLAPAKGGAPPRNMCKRMPKLHTSALCW